MSQNVISAHLSQVQMNDILAVIDDLKQKMDCLIDLDTEQRKGLLVMGDRSKAFVDRALEVAKNHSDILPRRFDLDEYERDVKLAANLARIQDTLLPFMNMLDDSVLAAGSDAYSQSLEVYAYAKAAGTGDGLDEIRRSMSRRFSKKRTASQEPEPA